MIAENALEFGTKASNFPEAVPEQASRQGVGPLHSREALRSQAALHTFKIRGVSFDGRQTPVSSLQASKALPIKPEKWCSDCTATCTTSHFVGLMSQMPSLQNGVALEHVLTGR